MDYYIIRLLQEKKDPQKIFDTIVKTYNDIKIKLGNKILEVNDELLYVVSAKKPKIILNATVLDVNHIDWIIIIKVKDDKGDCIIKLTSTRKLREK